MEAKDDLTLTMHGCLDLPVQTIHKSLEVTHGPVYPARTQVDLIFTLDSRSKVYRGLYLWVGSGVRQGELYYQFSRKSQISL